MDRQKLVSIVIYVIGFTLVWNVLDFLYSTFITHSSYTFQITSDMITPLVLMVIIQIVSMNRKK